MSTTTTAAPQIAPFLGHETRPTLGHHLAYIERWAAGSRAKARGDVLRAAGLHVTSKSGWLVTPVGRVDVTEIRVEPFVPLVTRIPDLRPEDVRPPTTTREQRARAARLRASVEST